MTPEVLRAYALVTLVLCLTPGPAVLFVLGQALWRGPRAGIAAGLGIEAGNVAWSLLAALGLTALLALSPITFSVMKWIGAAYLVWLGVQAWRSSFRDGAMTWRESRHAFVDALWVQMSNPKAAFYVTAILPQFVDRARPVPPQIATLAVVGMVIEAFTLGGYCLAAGYLGRHLAALPRFRIWLDRASGALLIGVGLAAALYRRA